MRQIKQYVWVMALIVLSLVVLPGCSTLALPGRLVANAGARAAATPLPTATPVPDTALASSDLLAALEGRLQDIYARVSPSVVNIQVAKTGTASEVIPGFPFGQSVPQAPQVQRGLGSGFVWDANGHIVTNNHVVADADQIRVVFADGYSVPAEVVGTDPASDLAVIKVDVTAGRLRPVQVADSIAVKVGQLAVAIGNPFGLEGTMTVGFVSALGRSLPVESAAMGSATYTIPDVIQTDAPINPGNSGGVLVDERGQVIGVTAAIESPVGANAGIGFAIPSAIVQKVVPVLIRDGKVEHTWLGISGLALMTEVNAAMGLDPEQRGVLVGTVTSGGPADAAGLKGSDREVDIEGQQVSVGGDVIVAIDRQPVRDFEDLVAYLARHTEVGQVVSLNILRDGKEISAPVTLAARPAQEVQSSQPQRGTTGGVWLGIQGMTVVPAIAGEMNLPADQQGVLVEQVVQGGPADEAGMRGGSRSVTINGQSVTVGGDVIVALDGQPVTQMRDLASFMGQVKPGQHVELTVLRDGKQMDLTVTLGVRPVTQR